MTPTPDATLAARIAAEVRGAAPVSIVRFTTGNMHYVYEATFADMPPVVVRIAADYGVTAMRGAGLLSAQLRPLGVPLPAILAQDLDAPLPWLALERLPGDDLGTVIATLPPDRLAAIADRVADAQAIVARTPTAGRYGYAARPEDAPHDSWRGVLMAHLDRSRTRILANNLFDPALAERAVIALQQAEPSLATIPATPFLHDTTTKNVIVTAEGGFSGIVDVDDLCFGDPRYVVALTAASLANRGIAAHYTGHWLARIGTGDSTFRLYVALFLLDFMSEHGQRFNGNETPSHPDERDRLQRLFLETLPAPS